MALWAVGIVLFALAGSAAGADDVAPADLPVVISAKAAPQERLAAEDLAVYLRRLYPQTRFSIAAALPAGGPAILVGSTARDPALAQYLGSVRPEAPEGFTVTTVDRDGRIVGVIAGADPPGTAFGVYSLLERLGCGFYLSHDVVRAAGQPFAFRSWKLSDRPLVRRRIIFNWHNFLSGCSAWNLPDWQRWIDQAQKMRFNTVMVHAYGNNPMFTFTHSGVTKPCGYLPTTRKGRDWGTSHVNDVRRLVGGSVFSEAEFGADAAKVPDTQRAAAVQRLMQQVFSHAARRGMHVCFALDIDTISSQPQKIILTLPPTARFEMLVTGNRQLISQGRERVWLVNPETPEGYAYYKAQAEALMRLYPQIDRLALWIRPGNSAWIELPAGQMPVRWREQYQEATRDVPPAAQFRLPGRFALAKVAAAFGRAMRELGHGQVELMTGSWGFAWMEPADRFFPAGMAFLPLDCDVVAGRSALDDPALRATARRIAARRPVIPIVWAHHDDAQYIGRSYTPFARFQDKLDDAGAGGFGIIHWTTRPLDLFFKSLAEQVWAAEKNQTLEATCREMGQRLLGRRHGGRLGDYLCRWVTEAPMFGRETEDWFFDRPLEPATVEAVVAACRRRRSDLSQLQHEAANADPAHCDELARRCLSYFRDMEQFCIDFYSAEQSYQQSLRWLAKGDLDEARQAIAACRAEEVLEQYARAAGRGGITRGEQGVLLALNLNWLPYVEAMRQAVAMTPVRYQYGPTSHEPAAQGAGTLSFYVDAKHNLWRSLGKHETGAVEFALPETIPIQPAGSMPVDRLEICRAGLESPGPLTLSLRPITWNLRPFESPELAMPQRVTAGAYRICLLMLEPVVGAVGRRVFDVAICTEGSGPPPAITDRIDLVQRAGGSRRAIQLVYPLRLEKPGVVQVTLTPVHGMALICGAVLEPSDAARPRH
jgi:hypothetical protein